MKSTTRATLRTTGEGVGWAVGALIGLAIAIQVLVRPTYTLAMTDRRILLVRVSPLTGRGRNIES